MNANGHHAFSEAELLLGGLNRRIKSVGLEGLANRLAKFLPKTFGTFIEIGANDGVSQSNTLILENRGWRGVLIEPVYSTYLRCCANRPYAAVFNCACGRPDQANKYIPFIDAGLMSFAEGSIPQTEAESHRARAEQVQAYQSKDISVYCQTLSAVLDASPFEAFDLLSLDVEGAELDVLDGLDFSKHAPAWVLIEVTDNLADVVGYLRRHKYQFAAKLSERKFTSDILFKRYE